MDPGLNQSAAMPFDAVPRLGSTDSHDDLARMKSAPAQSFSRRSRRALVMTETELRLIAAPATIGLSSKPKKG